AAWLVLLQPLAVVPARETGPWRWTGLLAGGLAVLAILGSRSLMGFAALAARAPGSGAAGLPRPVAPHRRHRGRGGSFGAGQGRILVRGDEGIPDASSPGLGAGLGGLDLRRLPRSHPAGESLGRGGRRASFAAGPARLRAGFHRAPAGPRPDGALRRAADRRARGGPRSGLVGGGVARPRRRRRRLAGQRRAGGHGSPSGCGDRRGRGARGERARQDAAGGAVAAPHLRRRRPARPAAAGARPLAV